MRSAGGEFVEKSLQAPNHGGIAWCGRECLFSEYDQRLGVKRGRKSLESQCSDLPVSVATRSAQKIDLARKTLGEGQPKLRKQRLVLASGGGKGGVKSSNFVYHATSCSWIRLNRGLSSVVSCYPAWMTGGSRIVAIGANGESAAPDVHVEATAEAEPLALEASWEEPQEEPAPAPAAWRDWVAPSLAALAMAGWSLFFGWAHQDNLVRGVTPLDAIALIRDWALPVMLVCVAWLLAMRTSRREVRRFGDAARLLSTESIQLEARLATVNSELSLAREFIAAQSRDIEALGRVAVERISQHAEKLAGLVQDNGTRIDTIGTVSEAALDNMEKLRGQLPVIASSAKDVTNQIGNAGRTAHSQLQDMVNGFSRLNEFGQASERQTNALRLTIDEAIAEFTARIEAVDVRASERLTTLRASSEDLISGIETGQEQSLAVIRGRVTALAEEISQARTQLDQDEGESITSLRARLGAVRDESGAIARSLQGAEAATIETWEKTTTRLEQDLRQAVERIESIDAKATESARNRIQALFAEAEDADARLVQRDRHFAEQVGRRETEAEERHVAALAQIGEQLSRLDAEIASRRADQEDQSLRLTTHGETVKQQLGELSERLAAIAALGGEAEGRLVASMEALASKLTASRDMLSGTREAVAELTDSSVRLLELIQASAQHSQVDLPIAIAAGDERLAAVESRGLILRDAVEAAVQHSADLTSHLVEGHEALSATQTQLDSQSARVAALRDSITALDADSARLAERTQGELRSAIAALSETAQSAVTGIETMSAESIRALADRLGEESGAAIERALRGRISEAAGQIAEATAHASGASREAALQLRDQLTKIDELAGNLERRVSRARERAEEQVDHDFARRVALITESLNSNSIDIARALDTDVSDTAWAAYLRGDRGVFTRRAVKLLEPAESKAIVQAYQSDDSFREHVSRYIHDFEAMLRQLLSTRDGHALGVTLLSSDMGKLYVALAQAIERLRK